MLGLITILLFVVLMGVPGFYIITRQVFPKGSKKSAMWLSILLTALLVGFLVSVMLTATV